MRQRISSILFLLCAFMFLPASGQVNYVRTYTPRTAMTPAEVRESNSSVSIVFYDEAGREVQTVLHDANVNAQDIAGYTTYDGLGRKAREYRPYPVYGESGGFHSLSEFAYSTRYNDYGYDESTGMVSVSNVNTDGYSSNARPVYGDSRPIMRLTALWGDSLRNEGSYSGGISGTLETDEDGNTLAVFKDIRGNKILERRGHTGETDVLDTYFVYDRTGFLRFVLPPACTSDLSETGTYRLESEAVLQKYAYVYRYDDRGNPVSVRMPGLDWSHTIYDGDGRPVLSQTPKQCSGNEWNFFRYDGLGRLTMQGTLTTTLSLSSLAEIYKDSLVCDTFTLSGQYGYAFSPTFCSSCKVDVVNYYDGYGFLDLPMFEALRRPNPSGTYPANGMQTGQYLSVLGGDTLSEKSSFYYDRRGRMKRSYRWNTLSGVSEQLLNTYNHCNQLTQVSRTYDFGDGEKVTSRKSYSYDIHGNELTASHYVQYKTPSVTRSRTTTLRSNTYNDDYGRLSRCSRFGGKEIVNYTYTAHDRLRSLSSSRFAQTLYYGDRQSAAYGRYFRNGRISSIDVTQGDNLYSTSIDYDVFQRYAASSTSGQSDDVWEEAFAYDAMGNVTSMSRNIAGEEEGKVFSMDGNHINFSADASGSSGGNNGGMLPYSGYSFYLYDANGNESAYNNMTMRVNHNRLNLPDSICLTLQGNVLTMDYLADGRRVRTSAKTYGTPLVFPGGGSTPQNPVNILEEVRDGELVFRDGQLVELRTDGGWFSMWNDTLSTTQVRPYFYVTDYLGSVRMVCDGITGEVRQSLEYLPSGYVFRSDNYAEQPYMFCGKELVKMHGINLYDSNARFQHKDLPRFSTMDPLSEKYYGLSPYNYAGNDFVNRVDPDGREVYPRSSEELNMIKNTLPTSSWKYIALDSRGYIDPGLLEMYSGDDFNTNSLKKLVLDKMVIEVSLDDNFYSLDSNGNNNGIRTMVYQGVDKEFIDNTFQMTSGTTTGEVGELGQTLFPDRNGVLNSTNDNINIVINKNLSVTGAAEIFSHEAYGHALMYINHNYDRDAAVHKISNGIEHNVELRDMILRSRYETIQNIYYRK